MSGPSYPGGGYPTDPNNPYNTGNPSGYPQQPGQPSYGQSPEYPAQQPYQPQPPAYGQQSQYPAQQPYQQPFQQQVPQPAPYQAVAVPAPKKSNSRTFLIIGIIAAVLLVACIGGCIAVSLGALHLGTAAVNSAKTQVAGTAALTTVELFCSAEQSQDYTSAYGEFSANLKGQVSQDKFNTDATNFDNTQGLITACTPQGLPNSSGTTATMTIQVTRTLTPTPDSTGTAAASQTTNATGTITLVEDSSGNWTIDKVDSSLNLL